MPPATRFLALLTAAAALAVAAIVEPYRTLDIDGVTPKP